MEFLFTESQKHKYIFHFSRLSIYLILSPYFRENWTVLRTHIDDDLKILEQIIQVSGGKIILKLMCFIFGGAA